MNDCDNALTCKKQIKWLLSRIEYFNNIVPHQIEVLTNHKIKIRQAFKLENFASVRHERINAEKMVRNLQRLLLEIDNLKEQVIDADHDKFDKMVQRSCELIRTALKDFKDFCENLPLNKHLTKPWNSFTNIEYNVTVDKSQFRNGGQQPQILMQTPEEVWQLEHEAQVCREMEKIEQDVQTLNEMFRDIAVYVHDGQEAIDRIEKNVNEADEQVKAGEKQLRQVAAKLKGGMYPVIGAIAGSIVAGPVGFMAGLKIGTLVAFTGGILGFSGGEVLKMKERRAQQRILNDHYEKQTAIAESSK